LFILNQGKPKEWLLPKVNSQIFSQVLADFADYFGLGKNKQVLLVLDRAKWHTSKSLLIPEGIHLEFLPSYSPELQPAERLWPLTNEPIVNKTFESIQELEEVLSDRLKVLSEQPQFISGLTCFHWWPKTHTCVY
jgi:transposase